MTIPNRADPVEDLPPTKWLSVLTDPDGSEKRAIEARSAKLADAYLRNQGLAADSDSRSRLADAMADAMKYGSEIVLLSDANGVFSANPFSPLPPWAARVAYAGHQFGHTAIRVADPGHPRPRRKQVTFDELFAGWGAEKQPREKTKYAWWRVLDQLVSSSDIQMHRLLVPMT